MDDHATIRVSVIPPAADLMRNAIFEGRRPGHGAHSPNVHWLDVYASLRGEAARRGIEMATSDLLPPGQADILFYMAQPSSPGEIAQLKKSRPGLKAVLVLLETSLGARYMLNPRNHRHFDAVLTYDERLLDGKKYFPLRTRAYRRDRIRDGLPFERRRVGVLVGTNRKMRWRSGIGAMLRGWHYSPADWADYVFCPGELITYRARMGGLCARQPEGLFDIFGEGWELDPQTGARCLGVPRTGTLDYAGNYRFSFALENHASENSLISERVWDALWGDTVPVYRGNTNLSRHVPSDCFIDTRDFGDPAAMLDHLVHVPKEDWEKRRRAGREFILSERVDDYLPERRAAEMLEPIALLAGQIRARRLKARAALPA